jgi:hypothetical protein
LIKVSINFYFGNVFLITLFFRLIFMLLYFTRHGFEQKLFHIQLGISFFILPQRLKVHKENIDSKCFMKNIFVNFVPLWDIKFMHKKRTKKTRLQFAISFIFVFRNKFLEKFRA